MKKKYLLLIGAVVIGGVFIWWMERSKQTHMSKEQPLETAPAEDTQAIPHQTVPPEPQKTQESAAQTNQPISPNDLESYGRRAIAAQMERQKQIRAKWKAQWDTPISFYGKV